MFKTSKMTTSAVDYFLDYAVRNEPAGEWYGMEKFGQFGEVTRESKNEYMNIMQGFHPKEGQTKPLVQGAGEKHVPGWDGIFAAPKSFSVAYAVADADLRAELDEVFRSAVNSSIGYMEDHYIQVRAGSQSKKDYEFQKAKLHAAVFLHHTSRMNDPHIHAHVNIFNVATSLVDGKERCLDSRVLHKGLKEIGTVFQQELARKLGKIGFECEFKENNTFEMKGISEEVCEKFSQRGEQIDLKMEATGTSGFKASAHAQKVTRPSKSELSWESMDGDWKREAKKLGFDSDVLHGLKKESRLKLAIPNQSSFKLARQAVENVTSTQSTFTRKEVLLEIVRISKGKHTITEIERSVDRALRNSIELVKDKSHYGIYTTKSILELERGIVNKALKRKKELRHCVRESWLRKYEKNVGQKGGLSREQFEALKHITVEAGAVKLVQGYAGTGKSWSLRAAKEVWQRKKLEVVGCALSGKAAQGLEDGSGITSSTIDSLLLKIENENKFQAKSSRPLKNTLLKENSVLVVDEAGMVDSVKMRKLLDYAHKQKSKVVMVGDTAQLQAIGAGAPFGLLQNHLKTAEIKTIIRQAEEWERQAVTQLAHGEIKDAIKSYEQKGRVHIEETNKDSLQSIVNHYLNERENRLATNVGNPMKGMLITCGMNENVNQINRLIREELEHKGALGQGIKIKTAQGEKEFAVNDRIVFGKNSDIGGVKVKNGSLGTVKSVSDIFGRNRLMVELDDGKKVKVNADEYTQLEHSYALTVHKAQGVTVDKSYNYLDGFVSTERLYTAQSRGREENHIFASNEVLNVETTQKEERRFEQLDKIIFFTQRDTKLNSVDELNKIIDGHEMKGKLARFERSHLLSNLRKYNLSSEIKALQMHVQSRNGLSSEDETMEALSGLKKAVKEKVQAVDPHHVEDKKAWAITFAIANEIEQLNLDIKCFPGIEDKYDISQKLEYGKAELKRLEVDQSQIEKLGVFSRRKLQWKLDDIQEQISAVTAEISKMEGMLANISYEIEDEERVAIAKEFDAATPRRDLHFSRTQQWMDNGLGGVLSELMEKAEGQTFQKEETRLVLASLQERVRSILETEMPGENHKGKAWAITYQIASELQAQMNCFTGLDAKRKNSVELTPFAWESVRENARSIPREEGYFDEQFARAKALRAVQTSGIARLDYRGLHSISNELMRASYSRHLPYNEKVISGVADAIQHRSVMDRAQAEKLAKSSIIDALNMRKILDKEKGIDQNEGEKEVKTSHSEEGNAYLLERFKDAVSRPASENAIIPEIKPVQNPGDSTTRFAMTSLGMKSEIKQLHDRVSDTELGKYETWQLVRALTPMVKTSLEKRLPDELYKMGDVQKYATKLSIDLVREAAFRAETKVGDFEEKPLKVSENIWVSRELSEIERGHSLHKRVAKLASENVEKFSGTATLWNNGARKEVKELLRMSQNGTLSGNQQQLQAIGSLIENYLPPKEYDENHKRLTTIMAEVKEHYHRELMANNPEANAAREYLKGRGFTDEQMKDWKVGLTSDHSLRKLFKEKSWKIEDMKELGLVKDGQNGRKDYEFFRNRVMIPINDKEGQTVGFGARIYKESDVKRGAPKYLNSPESPIFKKNEILFGQDKAQDSIKKSGEVILTEGYMDAIALQNKGVKNAVAVMGTAFTEKHAQSLETSAKKVVTLFDQDRAGLQAEMRSFAACNKRFDVKTMGLQGVKDPDEYLEKYGVEEFNKQKDRAVDFVEGVAQKVTRASVEREKLVNTYATSVLGAIKYESEKHTAHGLEKREFIEKLEKTSKILQTDVASLARKAQEYKPKGHSSSYAVWKAKNIVKEVNVYTRMKSLADSIGSQPSKVIRDSEIKAKDLGISVQAASFMETIRVPERARVIPGMESEARQKIEKHQHSREKYIGAVIKEKCVNDNPKVDEVVLVSAKTSYEFANKISSITKERVSPETINLANTNVVKDKNGEMLSVKLYKNAKERHLDLGKHVDKAQFKHHLNGAVMPLSRGVKEDPRQSLERTMGFKP